MLCNHCRHELPEDSLFCQYCGHTLAEETAAPIPVSQKQSHKKTRVAIGAALAAVLVAAGCFFLISGVVLPHQKYKKATGLLESGDFAKAEVLFLELEDYRDATEQVSECRFQEAVAYIEGKNYDALYAMGENGKFSPRTISYIQNEAVTAIAEDDFETAYALNRALAGEMDAQAPIQESLYQKALLLSKAGDINTANDIFIYLDGYKDSANYIHVHTYSENQTAAPTCESEGAMTYTCSCGHTYTTPVAATGHSYAEATCTAAKTCSVCKKTEGTALGHAIQDHVCSRCGAVQITLDDLQGVWKETWNSSYHSGYEIVTISGSSATIERYSNFEGNISHTIAVGSVYLTDYGFYVKGTYQYYTDSGELKSGTQVTCFGITKLTSTYLTENFYNETTTWYKQ